MTDFQTTAQAIAYALGEPPDRVDWATAWVYDDGEVRYRDRDDEREARDDAAVTNVEAVVRKPSGAFPVRGFAAFRETRVLADGTQIINPWREAADLDAATTER